MNTIFLSYSSRDYFFAEMLSVKLDEAGFGVWRDQGAIRAGDDWRQSIEDGITGSLAVVVALSASSAESAYVTYEWAYAMGMGKPVIPVKLSDCKVHPKLEPTQLIDFSYPRALPWGDLIERLQEIDVEKEATTRSASSPAAEQEAERLDALAGEILNYLRTRGFTMASFERLSRYIGKGADTDTFNALIASRPDMFRHARIKGGKPGIAKRVP